MRILHVAEAFGGGLMEIVQRLAEGTAEAGHDVAIAYGVRPETPDDLRARIALPVELVAMPWTDRSPGAQIAATRELRGLVKRWRPDVVHLHSSFAGVVGAMAVRGLAPTILSPHAYASALPDQQGARRIGIRMAERIASRRATVVGAVSHSEARFAREEYGAKRVEVVENGIPELDDPSPALPPADVRPRVIAAGRTVPQRQPVACARILAAVAEAADVAWIGGGGGDRGVEGYDALLAAGIRPTGWVSRERVLDELRRSTAYLHWTSWDGQPLSILEAMAFDSVVVASAIEPNRELLGPRQVCSDEGEAIDLLRRVVLDADLRAELLEDQRARRGPYGAQRMVDEWLALYARYAARVAAA